jgi:hypothetical protein
MVHDSRTRSRRYGARRVRSTALGLGAAALIALGTAGTAGPAFASAGADDGGGREGTVYSQTALIPIPTQGGSPLFADIVFGDQRTGHVYLSDLANSTLDVVDGRSAKLLAQVPGFTGGPAGVVADDNGQVWAGDGAGAIKVVSATAPYRIIDSVPVGAPTADETRLRPGRPP